jgi:hypothetical protein
MPLRDHFHGETELELPWPTMAQTWAVSLMAWLNRTLPKDEFQALTDIRLGTQVEADVAEYRRTELPGSGGETAPPRGSPQLPPGSDHGPNGSVATLAIPLAVPHAAPPAVLTIPAIFTDEAEIEIRERRAGRPLVGVIELVSPSNKDRPGERESFVAKTVTYLRRGVGVVIVDVVTARLANLHNNLMEAIGGVTPTLMPDTPTYVSGYRPVHRRATRTNEIEVWPYAAAVGQPVPAVPLGLRGGPVVLLDLEGTYTAALELTGL